MKNKGFTIIEIIISISILSLLGIALLGLQRVLGQNQILITKTYRNIEVSNKIAANIVRELRMARTAENGYYALEKTDDNELIFYSDVDFDGLAERVRYTRTGNSLVKGVTKSSGFPPAYPSSDESIVELTVNIRNLSEPVFFYYNESWPTDTVNNPLSTNLRLSNAKIIRIYLKINEEANRPEKDFIVDINAQIRILKENL
jgi:prepilin-type N-terminal cleavage/methylation domain-containing protein